MGIVVLQGCGGTPDAGGTGGTRLLAEAAPCELSRVATSSRDALLTEVSAIGIDSRGQIYVGDRKRAGVTVLNEDGAVLRTIGGSGEGPGEFKWINNVQVLPGDSVLVYDYGLNRITVFAPGSDAVAYTINLAAASSLQPPNSVERVVGHEAYVGTVIEPFRASGDDPRKDYEREQVVRVLNLDGSVRRDSVLVLRAGQNILAAREGRSITAMDNPFGRPGELQVGPDGRLYSGWGDSLAVEIYSVQGERVGGFSRAHEPPAITDQDVESTFVSEADARTFRTAVEGFVRTYASGAWPAFRTLTVDDRGRIWIGLLTPTGEPTTWVAFDEKGSPLCSTTLPENTTLRRIQGGKAYAVTTDEMNVPYVEVYRIGGLDE